MLFNIYEDFFESASVANIKKHFKLLLLILFGGACGLFGLSILLSILVESHAEIVYFSFMGMILGCIPMMFRKAANPIFPLVHLQQGVNERLRFPRFRRCIFKLNTTPDKSGAVIRVSLSNIAIFIVALAFMLFLSFLGGDLSTNSSLEQLGRTSPALLLWVFFSAFVSAIAMLVPGLGGSVMMLALGIYRVYLDAVAAFDLLVLAVLVLGGVVGTLSGIKLIKRLLKSYSQKVYCAILGFMCGSVFLIYPGFTLDFEGAISVVLAVVFGVGTYFLTKKD